MNVFGKNERSWRKARKRGVSPIIATILLVAITVVLAAVLYVLISGLTSGGVGSKPIGSAFNAGNPVLSQSGTGAASSCVAGTTTLAGAVKTGDYTYTLTVESSSITLGAAQFEVKTSTGAIAAYAGGFYVVNIGGGVVACSTGAALAMSGTFSTFPTAGASSTSTPLTSVYTIVIDMGAAPNPAGQGYTFIAIGSGSYSGTTTPVTLP